MLKTPANNPTDERACPKCSGMPFRIHGQHAKHMRNTHRMMVLEIVDINLGRAVAHVTCSNSERVIEKTVRGMHINMDRDKFFVREFGKEAYDSSNHGDTDTP